MLYRTHHHHNPFLFTFKPIPHSSPSSLSPHLLLPSISPHLQEMEFLQGAFGPVAAVKTTASVDNFCVSGDDLFVDELLDFSTALSETEEQEEKEQDQNKTPSVYVSEEKQLTKPENSVLSSKDDYGSELSVPVEGLESLEWLSHFVEDSFSDYPLTGILPPNLEEFRSEPKKLSHNPVTKARTKRARSGLRVWPVLSPSFSEPSTSSTSSTSSTTPPNFWAVQMQAGESLLSKPVFKKQKKKAAAAESAAGGFLAAQPRRCSHCGVTKTPQWRAGPLGSKTLCNACGVRYKSGRLVPEYRPACSPTFSSELHSNNHRKVMEMRRQKEMEFAAADPVQSF